MSLDSHLEAVSSWATNELTGEWKRSRGDRESVAHYG